MGHVMAMVSDFGGVVRSIEGIHQLKFWVKISRCAYSIGVQSFEQIVSPAN
jgi:hypothetical protein